MTTYVSVGLQRIQAHLARSRHLWGRRGASEEVIRLTMLPDKAADLGLPKPPLSTEALARSGISLNPEALDVDGVLSFMGDDEATAREAGMALARSMKRRLPGLTVEVSWVTPEPHEDYVDLLAPSESERWQRVTFQPAPYEFPLIRLCDECHVGPASHHTDKRFADDSGSNPRLCEDCFVRLEQAERRQGTVVRPKPTYPNKFCSEWWLLEELNKQRTDGEALAGVRDFNHLATLIRPDAEGRIRTHRDNHTALICADGNGLGGLFDAARALAAEQRSTKELQTLSSGIHEAMANSLMAATEAILLPGDVALPVVPHILGGDDLLVSLPAERCWQFLEVFLESFRAGVGGLRVGDREVSMSAGLVISKAELPLANQLEIGERLMRRAKKHVFGDGWSFTWLDVTQDGPEGEHAVWTLDDLADRTPALRHLSDMTQNSVQSIMGALSATDHRVAAQKLAFLSKRLDDVRDFMAHTGLDANTLTPSDVQILKDLVSVGRWWR